MGIKSGRKEIRWNLPARWKLGMDLRYVVSLGKNGILAISLPAAWLKADRSGQPLLRPSAVLALDRLRALFVEQDEITPGFIVSLREAVGLTQEQFGKQLGVAKTTVSRWERGRMRPSAEKIAAMRRLQRHARKRGVRISVEGEASKVAQC